MNLTLQVTGPQAAALGASARKVFSEAGGTIGRLRNNYWVLSDPWVSSHHAVIRFTAGVFYIEDTSTNGVFLNSPDNRLVPGQPYPIASGDRIYIDPYQIEATVAGGVEPSADPFGFGEPVAAPAAPMAAPPGLASGYNPILPPDPVGSDDNWLDQLAPGGGPPPPKAPAAADLVGSSPLVDHYRPPAPVTPPAEPALPGQPVIPADWFADVPLPDVQRPSRSAALPAAAPAAPAQGSAPGADPPLGGAQRSPGSLDAGPAPGAAPRVYPPVPGPPDARGARRSAAPPFGAAGGDAVTLAGVLEGAGIHGVEVTPELAERFGEILRVVVGGVMDILQARQKIKNEFRMEMTSFKPLQNNPLKFSANVDDALHNLLVKRNPAYLGPVEAFEDAFADLRNHQMAMLAGVRVAFDAMLATFDPDALQERFDREVKKGSLLNMPGKLRYWDQYCEAMRSMIRDSETTFRQLFGEEFATAYEEQLARLKGDVRSRKP